MKVFFFVALYIFLFLILLTLVIPGILFWLKYSQAYWIILEKYGTDTFSIKSNLSAMKRSAELTKGFQLSIFFTSVVFPLMFTIASIAVGNIDHRFSTFAADIVTHCGWIFVTFVMASVYVQLNPRPAL